MSMGKRWIIIASIAVVSTSLTAYKGNSFTAVEIKIMSTVNHFSMSPDVLYRHSVECHSNQNHTIDYNAL